MKDFDARGGADQGALQRGLGEELGLRPHDRPRDRPPGRAVQAGGDPRAGARSPRRTARSSASGSRCPTSTSVFRKNRSGRLFPVHPRAALGAQDAGRSAVRASSSSACCRSTAARASTRCCTTGSGPIRRAGDLLGRGRLDPGGQSGHERRAREDDLQGLQDLPALRPRRYEGAGHRRHRLRGQPSGRCPAAPRATRSPRWPARPSKAAGLAPHGVRVVAGRPARCGRARAGRRDQDVVYHVAGVVAARNEAEFLRGQPGRHRAPRGGRRIGAELSASSSSRRWPPAARAPRAAPLTGSEPPRPVTAYGRSKLASEADCPIQPAPLVDRPAADGLRPPRPGGAQGVPAGPIWASRRSSATARQELSAVHGADLADALVAAGGRLRQPGETYFACHPEIFTSAEFVRAIGRAMGAPRSSLSARRVLGRGAALSHRGIGAAHRPDHHPHRRQGQRVLSAGLDRRPGAVDQRHRLARRA